MVERVPDAVLEFLENDPCLAVECSADVVRLWNVDKVRRVDWRDLIMFANRGPRGTWGTFSGYAIGRSCYGDDIIWVEHAPVCDIGAVMAFGIDVAGPGGRGPDAVEPTLVLADSLSTWGERLAQDRWLEYGLVPGALKTAPPERAAEIRRLFKRLNPGIWWG